MKMTVYKFLVLISLAAAAHVAAAGTQTGVVTEITVRSSDGLVSFKLSNTAGATRPACASATTYWIVKDENSNAGKQQIAILMSAKVSNQTVTVVGSGSCTRWGDGEDANTVLVQ